MPQTIYGISIAGKERVLHSFTGYPSDGASPYASLIDMKGALYGTTSWGGGFKRGIFFALRP